MKPSVRLVVLFVALVSVPRLVLAAGCAGTYTNLGEDYGGTQCQNYPGGSFVKRVFYRLTFGNGYQDS
jgi:hypothetical protein